GLAQLAPDHGDHEGAQWRGDFGEEMRWALVEVGVAHPSRMDQSPIELILRHLFEGPRRGALLGREPAVEVKPVFPLDMPADEIRTANAFAIVVDIGNLAFRRFAEA